MRWFIALILILAAASFAEAGMLRMRSPQVSSTCPAPGFPTPNGDIIEPQPQGTNSCIFTDRFGITYQFQGPTLTIVTNGSTLTWANELEMGSVNGAASYAFIQAAPPTCLPGLAPAWVYRDNGGNYQTALSAGVIPNPLPFNIGSTFYNSFANMAASVASNQTMTVGPMQAPATITWGGASARIQPTSTHVTLNISANSGIGCGNDLSGIIKLVGATNQGNPDYFSINGLGAAQSTSSFFGNPDGAGLTVDYCFLPIRSKVWSLSNIYITNCYMGILSNGTASSASGATTANSNVLSNLNTLSLFPWPLNVTDDGGWVVGMSIWDRDGHIPYGSAAITGLTTTSATISVNANANDPSDVFIVDDPNTMTGLLMERNGDQFNQGNSATHDVYLGAMMQTATARAVVTNSSFLCQDSSNNPGFYFKTRDVRGQYTGSTFAEPDHTGNASGCYESAAIDLSCGGAHIIGRPGTGLGNTIEIGPGIGNPGQSAKGYDIVRYGRDNGVTGFTARIDNGTPGTAGNIITISNFNAFPDNSSFFGGAGHLFSAPIGQAPGGDTSGNVAPRTFLTAQLTANDYALPQTPVDGTPLTLVTNFPTRDASNVGDTQIWVQYGNEAVARTLTIVGANNSGPVTETFNVPANAAGAAYTVNAYTSITSITPSGGSGSWSAPVSIGLPGYNGTWTVSVPQLVASESMVINYNCGLNPVGWSDQACSDANGGPGGPGPSTCQSIIQYAWIINDSVVSVNVVNADPSTPANRVTISNSKIVMNTTTGAACTDIQSPSPCGKIKAFGASGGQPVVIGTGNLCYANRAAAGLPTTPGSAGYIPAPPNGVAPTPNGNEIACPSS